MMRIGRSGVGPVLRRVWPPGWRLRLGLGLVGVVVELVVLVRLGRHLVRLLDRSHHCGAGCSSTLRDLASLQLVTALWLALIICSLTAVIGRALGARARAPSGRNGGR